MSPEQVGNTRCMLACKPRRHLSMLHFLICEQGGCKPWGYSRRFLPVLRGLPTHRRPLPCPALPPGGGDCRQATRAGAGADAAPPGEPPRLALLLLYDHPGLGFAARPPAGVGEPPDVSGMPRLRLAQHSAAASRPPRLGSCDDPPACLRTEGVPGLLTAPTRAANARLLAWSASRCAPADWCPQHSCASLLS